MHPPFAAGGRRAYKIVPRVQQSVQADGLERDDAGEEEGVLRGVGQQVDDGYQADDAVDLGAAFESAVSWWGGFQSMGGGEKEAPHSLSVASQARHEAVS